MLIEVPLQAKESLADHAGITSAEFDAFNQDTEEPELGKFLLQLSINLRVMKICNLLEIHEDQILVITNNPRYLQLRIIDRFDVTIDNSLKVLPKFLFRFNELANYRSENNLIE